MDAEFEAIIIIFIFLGFYYVIEIARINSKYKASKAYGGEKGHFIIKERGPGARQIFKIRAIIATEVNNNIHDYQILTRTAFGFTQAKVVDLGPQEKLVHTGEYVVAYRDKKDYEQYLYLADNLVPIAQKSKIRHLLIGNKIYNDGLSERDAKNLLSWLSNED